MTVAPLAKALAHLYGKVGGFNEPGDPFGARAECERDAATLAGLLQDLGYRLVPADVRQPGAVHWVMPENDPRRTAAAGNYAPGTTIHANAGGPFYPPPPPPNNPFDWTERHDMLTLIAQALDYSDVLKDEVRRDYANRVVGLREVLRSLQAKLSAADAAPLRQDETDASPREAERSEGISHADWLKYNDEPDTIDCVIEGWEERLATLSITGASAAYVNDVQMFIDTLKLQRKELVKPLWLSPSPQDAADAGPGEGGVMVPRVLTEAMNLKGRNTVPHDALCEADMEDLWETLLESAPLYKEEK